MYVVKTQEYQSKRENTPHSNNSKFGCWSHTRLNIDSLQSTEDCTINGIRDYWCKTITDAIETKLRLS